jgi:hypothetical protein
MSLNINVSGVWKSITDAAVNVSGVWRQCADVYINVSGVWKSAAYESGTQSYLASGAYSFVVPAGVTSLTATIVGGGGGGGGSVFSGDGHGAANGGSGGKYQGITIAVTPGETLTLNVGAGGTGATSNNTGGTGQKSNVLRDFTVLFLATGGGGGAGVFGDNVPSFGGAAGFPSGVAGANNATWMVNRNTAGQGFFGLGQNGTGYGNGGLGGNSVGGAALGGTGLVGGTGAVIFSW